MLGKSPGAVRVRIHRGPELRERLPAGFAAWLFVFRRAGRAIRSRSSRRRARSWGRSCWSQGSRQSSCSPGSPRGWECARESGDRGRGGEAASAELVDRRASPDSGAHRRRNDECIRDHALPHPSRRGRLGSTDRRCPCARVPSEEDAPPRSRPSMARARGMQLGRHAPELRRRSPISSPPRPISPGRAAKLEVLDPPMPGSDRPRTTSRGPMARADRDHDRRGIRRAHGARFPRAPRPARRGRPHDPYVAATQAI